MLVDMRATPPPNAHPQGLAPQVLPIPLGTRAGKDPSPDKSERFDV